MCVMFAILGEMTFAKKKSKHSCRGALLTTDIRGNRVKEGATIIEIYLTVYKRPR